LPHFIYHWKQVWALKANVCCHVVITTTLQSEHMNLQAWAYEQEQIYLEYFDDGDIIFLEYPCAT